MFALARLVALSLALAGTAGPALAQQEVPEGLRPAPPVIADATGLRALFAERTLHGRFASGDPFIEYYRADGVSAYWQLGCLHQGQWWIDTLKAAYGPFAAGTAVACFAYPTLNDAADPACFTVGGPAGHERFYALGGAIDASRPTATVENWSAGNSEPLPLGQSYCPSS